MAEAATDFVGTDRFSLRRKLGAGGMGVVYEAHDRRNDKIVALKTLTRAEPDHIYRFKREFRTLADVSHPNLVELHELMSDGRYWFFTMELIKGVTFIDYVRPETQEGLIEDSWPSSDSSADRANSQAETEEFDSSDLSLDSGEMTAFIDEPPPLSSPYKLDESRLRSALRQLAEGVHHLHEVGKLHRDIKPSNVLVTSEGRVVILDFGLAEDVEPELRDTLLVGTPDYMSPEQGAQQQISRASDWYSVGVMLYEALTGRLPFAGKFFEVMLRKQTRRPVQPREINPAVPRDLNDLCLNLLRRNPKNRPPGHEIVRMLTGERRATNVSWNATSSEPTFVGRERQLRELHQALHTTRTGQTVAVYVTGLTGMGKSALVRTFLDQAKLESEKLVILQGRCYERESVPYKALDGVVDSLSKYLASLRDASAIALMPRNALALARVFPVMLQVDAIFDERAIRHETGDLFTQRRQAFGALRELLTSLAQRQPLIIWIDDLQWADTDSMLLLEELLRPPDGPPLLLIGSFRAEDVDSKPFLKQLTQISGCATCRDLTLNPLTKAEATELAQSIFSGTEMDSNPFIDSLVREASGNPFLLEQLSHYAMMNEGAATAGITLTTMLEERIRQLPDGSRQLLDTLAVAGRPVNQDVAMSAAGLDRDDLQVLNAVRAAQLARSGSTAYSIEVHHDRIGETLRQALTESERCQIHRRLAKAIEARGFDDPESLYHDYLGAGEAGRAAFHAEAAARKAAGALAFDRAALYFRRAIELAPENTNLIELKIALGDALANAGRPAEAAAEFLEAAKSSAPRQAIELQQRAGAQLLMGGHLDEGLEIFAKVLRAAGLTLPKGPRRALLSLIFRRALIRLRGLDFTERDAASLSEEDLQRIDVCWSIAAGLGIVDLIRGAEFQSRHMLLALRSGEVYRIARAMAFETVQTATGGGRTIARAERLAAKTEELARRANHPHATGMAIWARGLSAYLIGSWKKSAELCERAAEVLRDQCTGATWELTVANRFMLTSLMFLGELTDVSRRVPQLLSAALEQGNLIAATDLRTRLNPIWLAADDPDRARDEVISAMTVWPRQGFHLQHYTSLAALAQIELYTGDTEVAWKHIESQVKPLEKSLLLRTQGLKIDAAHLRARLALATASGSERERRLRIAEAAARIIAKEHMPWSDPLAALIRAALAHQQGDAEKSIALTRAALAGLEQADMALYAAAARRRLGELLGGDEGREMIARADEWLSRQQVKKPSAVTRLMAPGFD